MLWNPRSGDETNIKGVKRSNFRLHAVGADERSEGSITLVNPAEFELLQRFIRRSPPSMSVPGSTLKSYGMVTVR
ncbi:MULTISPECIES: tlde1 domain-containing protein [unclassified Caballeronia]|uniref:tlde1 domain-containing protein n=1 Tax=unclassified Caballeronia TaxID=2646786 RepID=UPI00286A44F3|nr:MULTISPECIES: tlde1 domain-containing protein [unclassified Caballeronia]